MVVFPRAMGQGSRVYQTGANHNGIPSFLTGHGVETDDTQEDEEDAEEDLGD
jgi:hypothetical protein